MATSGAKSGQTSPPAGTGFVPGLGEAFRINLSTGQGVYSYNLPLPDGVAGHTPSLSLEYAHGAAGGPFGLGWRLGLRTIARRLDFGTPENDMVERFVDSGVEIMPLADGTFRAMTETSFARYLRDGDGWRIEERNGMVHELGRSPGTRIADPDDPARIHEWLLDRSLDPSGNEITYTYLIEEGIAYPSEIRYAAYAVRFAYEDRPDVRTDGRMGFLRRRTKRGTSIDLVLDPGDAANERRIRSWTMTYAQEPTSHVSLLGAITMTSHGAAADGSEDVVRPPVTFGYTGFAPRTPQVAWMDPDDGDTFGHPPDLTDDDVALVTLDDAPLPGILQIRNGRQYYWPNRGDGRWGAPSPLGSMPQVDSFASDGALFIDADASGTADLVLAGGDGAPGYYENGGREGWRRFVPYPRTSSAGPSWTSGRIRLTDIDGDGRIDAIESGARAFTVWRNLGDRGWASPMLATKGAGEARPDVDFGSPLVLFADMNGDGLQDLVQVASGRVEYWPSLGGGRFGDRRIMADAPRLRDLQRSPESLTLVDVDGDGCADLVRVTAEGATIVVNRNGESFAEPVLIDTVPPPIPGTLRALNITGRAGAGLLWNSRRGRVTGYVRLAFDTGQPPYLLSVIENGAGLRSELRYRSAVEDFVRDRDAGATWETNFPFPLLVVAGTTETDAVSGRVAVVDYAYSEAHFEPRTRQFQGFRRTERIERGDESRVDTRTVFTFLMGQERLPGNGPEHAALNGMLARTEIFGDDGGADADRPYRVETADYDLTVLDDTGDGRQRVFVFARHHRIEDTERTDDVRGEEKTYDYDPQTGNVIREDHRGYGTVAGVAQPERRRSTETTYCAPADPGPWIIDRMARAVVRDEDGEIIAETRRYYDGDDFTGLPLGQVAQGRLTREEQLVLPEPAFAAHYAGMDTAALGYLTDADADGNAAIFVTTERKAYTAQGLVRAERDAVGTEARFGHDADGLFRTELHTELGDTTFTYDRAIGQQTRITYPDGSETRVTYDAQGRILATVLPGEPAGDPLRIYSYNDTVIPHARTARLRHGPAAGDVATTVTYFDGYGKEFQQRAQATDGQFVVTGRTIRNPWGDVKREFEPTFEASAAFALPATDGRPHRDFLIDPLGRVVRTVNYNGGVSTAIYRPFEVITADANDNDDSAANVARGQFDTPHREEHDVFRYRTVVADVLGGGAESVTRYVTGPAGQVLAIEDSAGTMATYTYDRLDNRLTIDHRDAGSRTMWYDARGRVVRARDAAGNDLDAGLDALGRIQHLTARGPGGAVPLETYAYDDPARNGLGRLTTVTYPGGEQHFTYDPQGRLITHEYRFDGVAQAETLTYEYDAQGRETAVVHTDGTRIERDLTPNGWVRAIPGFISGVTYDPRGLPTRITYPNGVVTETTFTPGPGRVLTQRTGKPGGPALEDVTYEYDLLDMLLTDTDTAPGGRGERAYTYDPLYQVSSATTNDGGAPVTRQYGYLDDFKLGQYDEADVILDYLDAAHPDRVAGVTPGGGARTALDYDANGNLASLPGKSMTYNAKNELARFETAAGLVATYHYDHQGVRVSKTVQDNGQPAVRTLFVKDLVEIRNGVPAYFVRLGHLRVAILHQGTTRFVHSDPLGGSAFFTDAAGTKIAAIAYHPFGNVASSNGAIDFRTYGVHPFDEESGFYYFLRRTYAPEIGRFLTPDPLAVYEPETQLHNPKALHPYVFTGNDPLNKVDMDGLSFWSVVGAVVGVIAAIAVAAVVVLTGGLAGVLIGIALAIALVSVSYVVASATAGTDFGEFMRGFMIGFNAGLNAIIATALFGPVVGIALGVINFLAAFDTIAGNSFYQGVLGWSSWLMPMSWLATGVGLVFFLLTVLPAIFTLNQVPAVAIDSISIDWGTGSIVTTGGWMFLPGFNGGYNLGNFSYITPGSTVGAHEAGHVLNVAAFGSIFHFVGAIDENVPPFARGAGAYAERFAESHDPTGVVPPWGEMWR